MFGMNYNVVWSGNPLAATQHGTPLENYHSTTHITSNPIFVEPGTTNKVAGKTLSGHAIFNGETGELHDIPGTCSELIGFNNGVVFFKTRELVYGISHPLGEYTQFFTHNDPAAHVSLQPTNTPNTNTFWVDGVGFTGLIVHQQVPGSPATIVRHPCELMGATVCVGWRDTCRGKKSGYVCTSERNVYSFALEIVAVPPCDCLRFDDHSPVKLSLNYKLPFSPQCIAISSPDDAQERIIIGTTEETIFITVSITPTKPQVDIKTMSPKGVHIAGFEKKNAYALFSGAVSKHFFI